MIDALFWYTGLVAWVLIVFGCVWTFVVEPALGRPRGSASHRGY
jgi:hypothetical protein